MIAIRNDLAFIRPGGSSQAQAQIKQLDKATSYPIPGHQFMDAFKVTCRICGKRFANLPGHLHGRHKISPAVYLQQHPTAPLKSGWDGRAHALEWSRKYGAWTLPAGLLDVVQAHLPHLTVLDQRRRPQERQRFEWTGPTPRGYQIEAVMSVLEANPPRGLLELPIRSGKTLIAGRIIRKLGWRTVFVVETDMLLRQSARALSEDLGGIKIGMIGGGNWNPDWITVATIQTLTKRVEAAEALLAKTDLLIVDEIHHMKATKWRGPIMRCDAWAKIGLSATIFRTEGLGIWLRACCGSKLYETPIQRLIDEGYLIAPVVLIYPTPHTPGAGQIDQRDYRRAYKELVVTNPLRNAMIADLAEDGARHGMRVLVDTGRVEQLKILVKMLETRGVAVSEIWGQTPGPRRDRIMEKFRRADTQVVVGTVLGEGVDIPELEMVINAEGLKSKIATIQRLRNLTIYDNKDRAVVVDFKDDQHPHLRRHSRDRLEVYRDYMRFDVRAVWGQSSPALLPEEALKQREVAVSGVKEGV